MFKAIFLLFALYLMVMFSFVATALNAHGTQSAYVAATTQSMQPVADGDSAGTLVQRLDFGDGSALFWLDTDHDGQCNVAIAVAPAGCDADGNMLYIPIAQISCEDADKVRMRFTQKAGI